MDVLSQNVDLKDKYVILTGPSSMIGLSVVKSLTKRQANILPLFSSCINLLDWNLLHRFANQIKPVLLNKEVYGIHLATSSGNVQYNQKFPLTTFASSALINIHTLSLFQELNVTKAISVMSSCAIADKGNKVLTEEDLWDGLPNKTIESHGLAKRILDAMSRFCNQQYGLRFHTCVLQNSFGPNDRVDLERTKVVMSLIKKYVDAKRNNITEVVNWGTGSPLREFVYCDDAAECIVQVLEKYNEITPINIASDFEISIKDLADKISNMVGYQGKTVWNNSADGQMRKKLSTEKMKKYIQHEFTDFDVALRETINWYEEMH